MRDQLRNLGELLMTRVRDKAIFTTQKRMDSSSARAPESWATELTQLSPSQRHAIELLIRLQTDQTIAEFLGLFEDDPSVQLTIASSDGSRINAVEHGDELPAAPFGRRGWIAQWSKYPSSEEYLSPQNDEHN